LSSDSSNHQCTLLGFLFHISENIDMYSIMMKWPLLLFVLFKLMEHGFTWRSINLTPVPLGGIFLNCQDRKQVVKISASADLSCGVPQGSILAPLLFLSYVNAMSAVVKMTIYCSMQVMQPYLFHLYYKWYLTSALHLE